MPIEAAIQLVDKAVVVLHLLSRGLLLGAIEEVHEVRRGRRQHGAVGEDILLVDLESR